MREQKVIVASENYAELDSFMLNSITKKVLLVCDSAFSFLKVASYFEHVEERLGIKVYRFDEFVPNPLYESVEKGVELFRKKNCDMIIAIGGGSAIDVAKCIKLYANMNESNNYLEQKIIPNDIEFLAMPTTAGTGSEATRYAVIYYKGEKQSISDYSCIPSIVVMDNSVLKTLPLYQKKATMMDAMCHAIESFWSVNSTEESKEYSRKAIQIILENRRLYLDNDDIGNENMLKAANIAGKAINVTQTTAGHAMCYKLTSLYGIAHGHAAALCVSVLWKYMVNNIENCIDSRGKEYLEKVFGEIAESFGCRNAEEAIEVYDKIVDDLELEIPTPKENDYRMLVTSVNTVRLKNNPVSLSEDIIDLLYHQILES